jgi:putative membrane protein
MFGLALALGAWLWWGFGISGGWLLLKLVLVTALLGYFVWSGRLVKRGTALPGARTLRLLNELPILLVLLVIFLVLAKPF